ncbi:hypothetical protein [Desulfosediminicola ganghwensis]|uniref:hypothetical protein n=1 Tax=Desulfosediminicola ganghwensis TaxID=2569540 RepID=UPI00129485E5|nr:hypothetical protein [Desulfosediminicola ganghwensis]
MPAPVELISGIVQPLTTNSGAGLFFSAGHIYLQSLPNDSSYHLNTTYPTSQER